MRVVTLLVVVALVVLVVLGILAQFLKHSSMFYPDRFPVGQWNVDRLPVKPRDVEFRTSDGVRLHGWHFPATTANAPLIVWFHGNGGNLSDRGEVASRFATRGVAVLLFDYRGYGKSEGTPSESRLYRDSLAAWDFAIQQLVSDPHKVILYGESLGGPYAAYVAAHRGGRCVIIENSFPSTAAVARTVALYAPFAVFVSRSLPTTKYLNEARLPVLVLHGRRDAVIPYSLGVELFDGLRVPKRFFTSETAGHCEIPFLDGERYYREVLAFVENPPAS